MHILLWLSGGFGKYSDTVSHKLTQLHPAVPCVIVSHLNGVWAFTIRSVTETRDKQLLLGMKIIHVCFFASWYGNYIHCQSFTEVKKKNNNIRKPMLGITVICDIVQKICVENLRKGLCLLLDKLSHHYNLVWYGSNKLLCIILALKSEF